MRALVVVDKFPSTSETFIFNQIYYLIDNGIQVDILSFKKNQHFVLHYKVIEYRLKEKVVFLRHGFNVHLFINFFLNPLFCLRLFFEDSVKSSLFAISNLDLFNRLKSYDVIHAHYGHLGSYLLKLEKLGFTIPERFLVSFHGEDVLPNSIEFYRKKYLGLIDRCSFLIANSIYTKNNLLKIFDHSSDKIQVLPASLDLSYFNPQKESNTVFSIVFCGRLIPLKAPIQAIRITHKLLTMGYNVKLFVIGSGPESEKCEKYIAEHRLEDKVKLLGSLTQGEIIEIYNSSDVFLFPGITEISGKAESQGLVVQEAQAMRLPVIVSDAGGIKYGLDQGVTGFIVKEGNEDEFIRCIIQLYNDPDLRLKMGLAGRDFVFKHFNIQTNGRKLLYYMSL